MGSTSVPAGGAANEKRGVLGRMLRSKKGESGYKNGNSNEALFNYPTGMALDEKDNLYVADTGNNAIRKITPEGIVSTFYKELN